MAAKSSGVPSATLRVPAAYRRGRLAVPEAGRQGPDGLLQVRGHHRYALLVFNNHKDYDYITKHVLQALGIVEAPKDEDTLNDAKN